MLKSKDTEHPYYLAMAVAIKPGRRQIDWFCESVSCILWSQKEDLHTATGLGNNGHFLWPGDWRVSEGCGLLIVTLCFQAGCSRGHIYKPFFFRSEIKFLLLLLKLCERVYAVKWSSTRRREFSFPLEGEKHHDLIMAAVVRNSHTQCQLKAVHLCFLI